MRQLLRILDELGVASKRELEMRGVIPGWVEIAADYGLIARVRQGWYARPGEHPEVVRAWRVGGRLTCVSAIAFHEGAASPTALHVEIPAGSAKLRDPDRASRRLSPESRAVVLHWTRHPGPGGRRAVSAEHATALAARCYAAARASASRMV